MDVWNQSSVQSELISTEEMWYLFIVTVILNMNISVLCVSVSGDRGHQAWIHVVELHVQIYTHFDWLYKAFSTKQKAKQISHVYFF